MHASTPVPGIWVTACKDCAKYGHTFYVGMSVVYMGPEGRTEKRLPAATTLVLAGRANVL